MVLLMELTLDPKRAASMAVLMAACSDVHLAAQTVDSTDAYLVACSAGQMVDSMAASMASHLAASMVEPMAVLTAVYSDT